MSRLSVRGLDEVCIARDHVRKALCDWGLGEQTDLTELVVSELATNALCHGGGTAEITISRSRSCLRLEVHDDGPERPVRRLATADDEAGRGLMLIDTLAELYGGSRSTVDDDDGPGKTVCVVLLLTPTLADVNCGKAVNG